MLFTNAVAIEEGKMASSFSSWAHTCGAEFFDWHPIDEMVREACSYASKQTQSSMPPAGLTNVILDPRLVGLLAHEAIGHTAEADLVLAGSFTQGKIGQKICDEQITLIDSPITLTLSVYV